MGPQRPKLVSITDYIIKWVLLLKVMYHTNTNMSQINGVYSIKTGRYLLVSLLSTMP